MASTLTYPDFTNESLSTPNLVEGASALTFPKFTNESLTDSSVE